MILNTEKYIKDIGFNYKWLDHGNPDHLDPLALYQTFSVCKDCYMLHNQIEKLRVLHSDFGKAFGIKGEPTTASGKDPMLEDGKNVEKMMDYIIEKHFS